MRCPFCAARPISAGKPKADGGIVVVPVTCERRGKSWHERYDPAAIYELDENGRPIFDD
jgi:hypothetical protein